MRLFHYAWASPATLVGLLLGLIALALHARVHVRQYERYGVLFFPLYLGSSLVEFVRGHDPYRDNRFEREAFAAEVS